MVCSCCGEDRDDSMVAALQSHDKIKVCRVCVGWLNGRVGGIDVTPTLPVADMDEAVRFCETAGFDVQRYDDGFAFVHFDDQSVFDLDLIADMDPSTNHAGCYILRATPTSGIHVSSQQVCRSLRSRTRRGACTSSR